MEPWGKWTHRTPSNPHTDPSFTRLRILQKNIQQQTNCPEELQGFALATLEVANESSLGSARPRSFPCGRRFGVLDGSIVTHIGALHPEDNVLSDVGGMVGD